MTEAPPSPAPKAQGMTAEEIARGLIAGTARYRNIVDDPFCLTSDAVTMAQAVISLTQQLAQARAEGAVLLEAAVIPHPGNFPHQQFKFCLLCKSDLAADDDTPVNKRVYVHKKNCAVINTPAATAFLSQLSQATARAERAEKNQRTPGTDEVCSLCGAFQTHDAAFRHKGSVMVRCGQSECPIREALRPVTGESA